MTVRNNISLTVNDKNFTNQNVAHSAQFFQAQLIVKGLS